MKRIVLFTAMLLALLLHGESIEAMTVNPGSQIGLQASSPTTTHSKTILLLNWLDDRLITTEGIIFTKGIPIDNQSGIQKQDVSHQQNQLRVEFVQDTNRLTKIVILPSTP